ncbi:umecyanin-like [Malania oleifera]|uniref:umecyanin-like n=1 Tax=Malania oleifera TaxID=397392 RepID=UPI0025AE6519|nr:umecyanin-like [Malania oleifera]
MRKSMLLILFGCAAILGCNVIQSASAMTHVVGGSFGWTVPPNKTFYQEWAKPRTFGVGDELMFPFRIGMYNVLEVSEKDFNACTQDNVVEMYYKGPTIVSLNKTGGHFFYSGVGLQCEIGLKLAINVTSGPGSAGAPLPAFDFAANEVSPPPAVQATPLPPHASSAAASLSGVSVGLVSASGLLAFSLSLFI